MPIALKILIVGSGISGLSTAISLLHTNRNHIITILERHPTPQALGGPIGLTPNATRILIHYGLKDTLGPKASTESQTINFRRWKDGEILDSMRMEDTEGNFGFPGWGFSRFKLQEHLTQVALERGVKIEYNAQVTSVDLESPKPLITLKDGQILHADLIIGADGIRSVIRDAILGPASKNIKTSTPYGSYNVNIPRSLLASDPDLAPLTSSANFWLGPQIIVAINMREHGDMLNIAFGTTASNNTSEGEGEWGLHGDLSKLKQIYANHDPKIVKLLNLADPSTCYTWRLSDLPPLPRWSSENGNAVLVGDAAHAMLPTVGMGAGQCIEDSACLALCLDAASSITDLKKVLGIYEAVRKPRTDWLIKRARTEAAAWHLPDGEAQQQRDAFIKANSVIVPKAWDGVHIDDPPEGEMNPLSLPYQVGYDIIDHTKRRLKEILG